MIYPVQNRFVISSGHVWLPGSYESKRAAKYAFRFSDDELQKLQDSINDREPDINKRVISFADLQQLGGNPMPNNCKVVMENHSFNTVGQFEGEDVLECEWCRIRIAGFEERWAKPFLTVDLENDKLIFHEDEDDER